MKPTREQLAKASFELESLAYDDAEVFYLIAGILDRIEWVRAELAWHKTQVGWKRSSEVAVIGSGGASIVETQWTGRSTPRRMHSADAMVRGATKLRHTWVRQLTSQTLDMETKARELGYPHRSQPEGWRVTSPVPYVADTAG